MPSEIFSAAPELSSNSFDTSKLDELRDADLDALGFGVIALDAHGTVLRYNQYESRLARLDRNQLPSTSSPPSVPMSDAAVGSRPGPRR